MWQKLQTFMRRDILVHPFHEHDAHIYTFTIDSTLLLFVSVKCCSAARQGDRLFQNFNQISLYSVCVQIAQLLRLLDESLICWLRDVDLAFPGADVTSLDSCGACMLVQQDFCIFDIFCWPFYRSFGEDSLLGIPMLILNF